MENILDGIEINDDSELLIKLTKHCLLHILKLSRKDLHLVKLDKENSRRFTDLLISNKYSLDESRLTRISEKALRKSILNVTLSPLMFFYYYVDIDEAEKNEIIIKYFEKYDNEYIFSNNFTYLIEYETDSDFELLRDYDYYAEFFQYNSSIMNVLINRFDKTTFENIKYPNTMINAFIKQGADYKTYISWGWELKQESLKEIRKYLPQETVFEIEV